MSQTIVIFGASGDLTSRKLIPALYQLYRKNRLRETVRIVGFSRTPMSDEQWRNKLAETTQTFSGGTFTQEKWDAFSQMIHYFSGDIEKSGFDGLETYLRSLENTGSDTESHANRLYYLSTSPVFYASIAAKLGAAGMASEKEAANGTRRVIIEKPFGTNLETAKTLNTAIHQVFKERQIYRIDHYLGKETVNNVLVFRFANTMFEPVWNRNYIDNIQITANEEVTVGHRAAFYEKAGILRDMFQNHLLQILTFVLMEPPSRFEADAVRDEKVKVLRAIRAMAPEEVRTNTIRGQYRSYRDEPGVDKDSQTATYAAVRLMADNWRWKDVPIYLRSGKAMSCRTTQIVIQFKQPPHSMFQGESGKRNKTIAANRLLIQIQPAEGIQIYFQTKVPDTDMKCRETTFNFNFRQSFQGELPEAYERLLLDAMNGDASLFARSDEVEAAWEIIDPIQNTWETQLADHLSFYEAGSWGPNHAADWIRQFGQEWFDFCPLLHS
ncbi:MAG: glucose-6-phosphate dehydrogenase [Planctomycetaceae bacterium]|jgi:glucose-6-phosphate 1-dehydrogenase|nr:glucose-6-phosphate dehydrogenase [Planctomycetaceae bacterium]